MEIGQALITCNGYSEKGKIGIVKSVEYDHDFIPKDCLPLYHVDFIDGTTSGEFGVWSINAMKIELTELDKLLYGLEK